MAQSVERPALALGSGHDTKVIGSSFSLGSALSGEPAYDSVCLSLSLRRRWRRGKRRRRRGRKRRSILVPIALSSPDAI